MKVPFVVVFPNEPPEACKLLGFVVIFVILMLLLFLLLLLLLLLESLLLFDPERRLDIDQALESSYLSGCYNNILINYCYYRFIFYLFLYKL